MKKSISKVSLLAFIVILLAIWAFINTNRNSFFLVWCGVAIIGAIGLFKFANCSISEFKAVFSSVILFMSSSSFFLFSISSSFCFIKSSFSALNFSKRVSIFEMFSSTAIIFCLSVA